MTIKCPKCQFDNPDTQRFCGECGTQIIPAEEIPVSHTKTLETQTEELTRGSTFAGRYEIIEELGKGGMGKVYRVEDKKIKEEIALKLIKPEIASDKKTIERFSNELRMARKISHRNVCRMFDLGEAEGTHYITMEYVPGEDLKSFIRRVGQLPVGKTISIAKQVCEGLSEAHRLGVVHRDLKPQNIMIDKEGNARIMDFGIARSVKGKGITGAGVMIGTPEYMSPEQVEGKEIDQRSDIYSLGVNLYEMVTGQVPFEGDTPFTIGVKHKSEEPQDPKELNAQIPDDLNRVILRCMEKDKENRYQSAGELRSELENIEKGIPTTDRVIPKRKATTSKEITVTFSPKKLLIPVLAIVAIVIVVGYFFLDRILRTEKPEEEEFHRITVTFFENRTGDEKLDHIGSMVATYITQGLNQSGTFAVLPPAELESLGDNLLPSERIARFAERLGLQTVITGTYTKQGENLSFDVNVTDSKGEIVRSISNIAGPVNSMEPIEEIRQRIMGVLAQEFDPQLSVWVRKGSPPKYEALLEFNKGWSTGSVITQEALQHYLKAYEIDSTFHLALLYATLTYMNLGMNSEADSILKKLDKIRNELAPFERYSLDEALCWLAGDWENALIYARKMAILDPTMELGVAQWAIKTNRLEESIDAYMRYGSYRMIWYEIKRPYHILGRHEEELEAVEIWVKNFPKFERSLRYYEYKAEALSALGRIEEVEKLIDDCFNLEYTSSRSPGTVIGVVALELREHDYKNVSHKILKRAIDWYKSHPPILKVNLAKAFYQDEQWEEAKAIFDTLVAEDPDNIEYNGWLGVLYARLRDSEAALKKSEWLGNLELKYRLYRPIVWKAKIAAILGEKENAVNYLREAYRKGYGFGIGLHRDMDLESLREYSPYEEFMRPRK